VSGWTDAVAASATLPEGFALTEAHPNPFTGETRFTLELAETQAVTVEVYDGLGRRVAVLHDGTLEAGAHALVLDGAELPAGAYVVRVTGEAFAASRRITLLR
jgi:flagellar hook assembly protein FlgD